jgi:murein DD-endopeptidase MepM/ murein hydrolase activator NlpD
LTNAVDGLTYSGAIAGQPAAPSVAVSFQSQQATASTGSVVETPFESAGLAAGITPDGDVRVTASSAGSPTANLPPCDTSQSILYCVYTIQPGDTLSSIASAFGLKNGEVAASDLLVHSNRPDIASEDDLLQIGQKIRVPTQQAVVHLVRSGETASTIADIYEVPLEQIALLPQNQVTDLNNLSVGQELLVPEPKRFARPAPAVSASSSGGSAAAPSTAIVRGGQASLSGFIWPASGPISSYFTGAHPLGIDIDFHSSPNQAVGAAAAGTVVFAGGNPCCSYGYYVVVSHGNGFETLYAHFSSIAVSVGQRVAQGQILGYGGRTGYATGNHLHFEVHLNGVTVNPLVYLP